MAVLQVNDIDDNLYERLRIKAEREKRSIREEIIMMLESYVDSPGISPAQATEEFLKISWSGDESADEIISNLRNQRKNSRRFENHNDLFD